MITNSVKAVRLAIPWYDKLKFIVDRSMKIVTANVNGIRAAGRKGFFDWVAQNAELCVCIQETKAQDRSAY